MLYCLCLEEEEEEEEGGIGRKTNMLTLNSFI
jgi:hypothetical protein